MTRLLLFCFYMIFFAAAKGQTSYTEAMQQGDDAFNRQQYKTAINKYFAAEAFDPTKKEKVKQKINRVFDRIEALRKEAEKARAETQEALTKANRLINAFYFYKDRFALAMRDPDNSTDFYFFDKNGDEVEKLGEWFKAEIFEESTGFAKVQELIPSAESGEILDCLLDTLGNIYRVAYNLGSLYNSPITALDLSKNQLDSFPAEALNVTQLKVLILNVDLDKESNIKILPSKINKLQNLEYLYLSNSLLNSLPSQISELKSLRSLILNYNELENLPSGIGKLKSLEYLKLNANRLDSLPIQIGELENLRELDLGLNPLRSLPYQIGELKNLEVLDLAGCNQLANFPEQICKLSNLTDLNLSSNELKSLPFEIGNLKNLVNLDLSNNELNSLPIEIGKLNNLGSLNLSVNNLKTLPPEIGNLRNLKTLDLSNNELRKLPTQIRKLRNLTELYLIENRISESERKKLKMLLPHCDIIYDEPSL